MKDRRQAGAIALVALLAAATALGFSEVPKDSARALGVTRGRPFTAGAVFLHGKYLEPPYVVERWGTGLRINGKFVSGQIVDWTEFLKTQSGVKVTRTEAAVPAAPAPTPAPAAVADVDENSLDDLFDDDPKPKKKAEPPRRAAPARPKTTVSYSFDGTFVPNDTTRALVKRINAARTEIDRILRAGGFLCFGNSYSRVAGDARTLQTMLEKLPEIQQRANSVDEFRASIRQAHLVYLNEVLCEEMFRNRMDYPKLRDLRMRIKKDLQWQEILDGVKQPLL